MRLLAPHARVLARLNYVPEDWELASQLVRLTIRRQSNEVAACLVAQGTRMKNAVIAALLLAPLAAIADPVYLECTITSGAKGDVVWEVTLDESQGTASTVVEALNTRSKLQAVFTADKVTFGSVVISRKDLSMVRSVTILGETKTDRGQCKLVQAPVRKF